jgi:tRNA(fMet)-specific endonuclease VapC
VTYLLDTNACIAIINGSPQEVRLHLEQVIKRGEDVAVPAVAAFELWYGAAKSTRRQANERRLESFFAGPLELLPFGDEDARAAGEIRAALEARGTPIGAYDLPIAGQASRHGAILVTARPRQWSKNVLVFGAPITGGVLLQPSSFVRTILAFLAWYVVPAFD